MAMENLPYFEEESLNDPGAQIVVVVIPGEILIQMVEAQPSLYDPALVEEITQLRAAMKQKGNIPQFDEIPPAEIRVPLSPEVAEAVSADARAAGRTLAEQIQYEIEVNHGWRFPDPGDTASEERIREQHTIRECLNLYLRFHVRFSRVPRDPAHLLLNYCGPLLSVHPAKLTRASVVQWAQAIGQQHPSTARTALDRLRGLYAKANEWGLYTGENPAVRHRLFRPQSRSRFLQPEELARLIQILASLPLRDATYFLTLLLTGARRAEAARMRWADLDMANGLWYKPTTKNGQPHTVPLPKALQDYLHLLPRTSPYVFTGDPANNHVKPDGHLSLRVIQYHWERIRRLAAIPDVRIHDLRRTCASWLAIGGENISVIQKVLNHSSLAVTQVYARLNLAPVRAALEGNAQRMLMPEHAPQAPTQTDPQPGHSKNDQLRILHRINAAAATPQQDRPLFPLKLAAKDLGMSPRTLLLRVRSGEYPSFKNGRNYVVDPAEIREMMQQSDASRREQKGQQMPSPQPDPAPAPSEDSRTDMEWPG